MRAVQFSEYGPPGVMHLAEVPEPHAGPGRIRISVRASGVSPGEVIIRSGKWRDVVATTFPYRTGFDAAGVVDEVGDAVTGVAIGDEVFGMTTMATRASTSRSSPPGWAGCGCRSPRCSDSARRRPRTS